MGPDKIMIIRHAEKPTSVTPGGVDETGAADFAAPVRSGIIKPDTIVASVRSESGGEDDEERTGRRAQQTIAPLQARLDSTYWDDIAVGSEDVLVQRLKAHAGIFLVAWTHKRIHNIVAGFVEFLAPEWDGTRFDAVWILDRSPDHGYRFSILNQDLLAGDRPA
jgi:hypothetical protein